MDEDNYQLILNQYNSKFVTYQLSSGIYSIVDISKVLSTLGDHEGTLQIEYNDINMKTKLILTRFGSIFGVLKIDKKPFLKTFLCFTPYWEYKPTNALHADSPGVYTSDKTLPLKTKKIRYTGNVNAYMAAFCTAEDNQFEFFSLKINQLGTKYLASLRQFKIKK